MSSVEETDIHQQQYTPNDLFFIKMVGTLIRKSLGCIMLIATFFLLSLSDVTIS